MEIFPKGREPNWGAIAGVRFMPFPPDEAYWLAAEIERRHITRRDCDICEHPKRQILNELILRGDEPGDIVRAACTHEWVDWNEGQINHHKIEHLWFQIKHEIRVRPDEVMLRPPPPEMSGPEFDQWYSWRCWAMSQAAYEQKDYGVALKAHALLRAHVHEPTPRLGSRLAPTALPAPRIEHQSAGIDLAERRERELLERFKATVYRKSEEDE